ncbi:MAG: hypothetical protein CMN75_17710 [Spirochaeta sp.]|nr:hypothetical protein [Spirochaeta sp.]
MGEAVSWACSTAWMSVASFVGEKIRAGWARSRPDQFCHSAMLCLSYSSGRRGSHEGLSRAPDRFWEQSVERVVAGVKRLVSML